MLSVSGEQLHNMLRKGIKWMLTNRPQYCPVCPKWSDMPCLWWCQLVEAKTAEYLSVVDDCIICCAKAENKCWHTGHNIGQRPFCFSQMKWPDLPLVMPTGGGKDSRVVRSSSSPSLTCQRTCPQTTTAKTGQKRATGQNGPKSC